MFQFSHTHGADHSHEYCEACGQRLPPPGSYGYGSYGGPSRHKRIGIGISIALHLLIVLYYLFSPQDKISLKPPAKEGEMVWVAPLKDKPAPKAKPEPKKTEVAKAQPQPRRESKAVAKKAAPPKLETYVPPVQATMKPPPTPAVEEDMMARVEAARKRRADANPQPAQEPQESEADRANRIARANIMGAMGRNAAGEREDTGGIFSIINKTGLSADIKFRGWNTNFKRQWSQQVHVELGADPDIETAIVRRMIELIRKEKPGEFQWESHRLGKVITMNAAKPYQAELEAFLLKEFFPNYRR